MSGISEALVATAAGAFVAIPAVVAFNAYNRRLKTIVARTEALGQAFVAHLQKDAVRAGVDARDAPGVDVLVTAPPVPRPGEMPNPDTGSYSVYRSRFTADETAPESRPG